MSLQTVNPRNLLSIFDRGSRMCSLGSPPSGRLIPLL